MEHFRRFKLPQNLLQMPTETFTHAERSKYSAGVENVDDLIQKYATPLASSSPASIHHSINSTSQTQQGITGANMIPFSSPVYTNVWAPQQRCTSSNNSGYLRRGQLFGREASEPSFKPHPPSLGLERIIMRRRRGMLSPQSVSGSSVQAQSSAHEYGALVEHNSVQTALSPGDAFLLDLEGASCGEPHVDTSRRMQGIENNFAMVIVKEQISRTCVKFIQNLKLSNISTIYDQAPIPTGDGLSGPVPATAINGETGVT
ncbi:hypothetical protein DE146DRAFT_772723 [Phaeosphaeria sp. MPI-PUGE-AT-0046c]|nr:hypothetical protein DE146DRAFT_772723 [Phaeosphaeria sp. MPI-PUGE-AT-0046c]